ncbi:MAG: NAD-dependent epimerase/dehydratase family protein [Planctomycetes bacterium]|nr:NAD-dependent epimerase/dehydratase family protein [Planctomycetota bacterium]
MRILITGGTGFVGSHLAQGFLDRGDSVLVLDTASTAKVLDIKSNPAYEGRFQYVKGSVLDYTLLDGLMRKADLCYHLAAVVGVEHYVDDPFGVLDVNINGTQNVLRAAFHNDTRVVFSSTSEIYGKSKDVPFKEYGDRLLGPTAIDRWCYSTSKAAGEHFCFAYGKFGLPVVILRYFNVYGPKLDKIDRGRVMTIFMGQLLRGEPLTIVNDGRQTRAFTYIDDAVRATMACGLVDEAVGGIFNIGTDRETTILELAKVMLKEFGRDPEDPKNLIFKRQEDVYGKSYQDIDRRVPDVTRMKTILKVLPQVSLEEGVRKTCEWFKKTENFREPLAAAALEKGR